MKTIIGFTLALLLALSASAFAFDGVLPTSNDPAIVQNVKAIAPSPAAATCITTTGHKGVIATVSTVNSSGKHYLMLSWTATDANGTPVVVKRYLNSNTAFQPGSSGDITLKSSVTSVGFNLYSSAVTRTTAVCVDLQ